MIYRIVWIETHNVFNAGKDIEPNSTLEKIIKTGINECLKDLPNMTKIIEKDGEWYTFEATELLSADSIDELDKQLNNYYSDLEVFDVYNEENKLIATENGFL